LLLLLLQLGCHIYVNRLYLFVSLFLLSIDAVSPIKQLPLICIFLPHKHEHQHCQQTWMSLNENKINENTKSTAVISLSATTNGKAGGQIGQILFPKKIQAKTESPNTVSVHLV